VTNTTAFWLGALWGCVAGLAYCLLMLKLRRRQVYAVKRVVEVICHRRSTGRMGIEVDVNMQFTDRRRMRQIGRNYTQFLSALSLSTFQVPGRLKKVGPNKYRWLRPGR
jgi:hypothetical protein